MGKKGKTPDMNLPVWFDGQNINEALFCEEFLHERMVCPQFCVNTAGQCKIEQKYFKAGAAPAAAALPTK